MASRRHRIARLFLLELLFHWCLSQYSTNSDPNFIDKIIGEHNKYRSQVSPTATAMLYITWDKTLAETALAWAKLCRFEHNPKLKQGGLHPEFKTLGQNIWVGSSGAPMEPTQRWVETEVGNYDFDGKRCTQGMCGHYTQVVWATTYRVGCAVAFCSTVVGVSFGDANLVVCDYGPPGNFRGESPFKAGVSCSECPAGDTCEKKLCRNAKRDQGASAGGPGAGPPGGGGGTGTGVPGTGKPSIGNTLRAPYGGTAFVMLHFHSVVFILTQFLA